MWAGCRQRDIVGNEASRVNTDHVQEALVCTVESWVSAWRQFGVRAGLIRFVLNEACSDGSLA